MKRFFNIHTIIVITIGLFLISSCKKQEGVEVNYSFIDLHEDINVQKVFFRNNNIGYACGGKKGESGVIYKTNNGGISWQKVYSNSSECLYDINFVNDTLGFACGENILILRTTDGGLTWTKHEYTNLPPSGFIVTLRNIFVVDENAVYIAGGLAYESGLTYKTFNQGDFWIYNNFGNELRSVHFIDKYTGFFAGYGTILKTKDSAFNFSPLDIKGDFYTSIDFVNNNTAFACGYNGGIYKTSDLGTTWQEKYHSNSAHISHFNYLKFSNPVTGYAIGSEGLIAFTTNGEDWSIAKKFTDDNLFSICFKNNRVLISGQGGRIYILDK